MYLRLLVTRQAIQRIMREGNVRAPGDPPPVPGTGDNRRLQERLAELKGTRAPARGEAEKKLAFLDAELTRIEEQVELIREQAVLSTDPDRLSERIDEISATLGATGDWIADQQKTIGALDDLIADPPPLASQT